MQDWEIISMLIRRRPDYAIVRNLLSVAQDSYPNGVTGFTVNLHNDSSRTRQVPVAECLDSDPIGTFLSCPYQKAQEWLNNPVAQDLPELVP